MNKPKGLSKTRYNFKVIQLNSAVDPRQFVRSEHILYDVSYSVTSRNPLPFIL